jgi:hypothetical protein
MANTKFSALAEKAEAAGVGFYEPASGPADLTIKTANVTATRAGDPKIGVQFTQASGPDAGKSFWTNFSFPSTSDVAVSISFRTLAELGFPKDAVVALPEDNEAASAVIAAALAGTRLTADLEVKKSNDGQYTNINLKRITRTDAAAAPAPAPAPAVVAATSVDAAKPF